MEREEIITRVLMRNNAYNVDHALDFEEIVSESSRHGLSDPYEIDLVLNQLIDEGQIANDHDKGHLVFWLID